MMNPLISITIPTYNREKLIPRAIESVHAQSYSPIELIVIDDGSTDNTPEVVSGYDDVTYIRKENNRGISKARNVGIQNASGEYILFLDSDDELLPASVGLLADRLSSLPENCAGIVTDLEKVFPDGSKITKSTHSGKITMSEIADGNDIGGFSGCLFRSSIFSTVGMLDEDLPRAVDVDFFVRILQDYHLYGINETVLRVYDHGGRVTHDPEAIVNSEQFLLEKHKAVFTPQHRAMRYDRIGCSYAELGEMRSARKAFARAIRTEYSAWYSWYHYLLAWLPRKLFQTLTR